MAGHTEVFRPSVAALAETGWLSPPGLRQFVPATVLGSPDEGYRLTPLGDPSEPSISSLAHANALAVVGETELTVHPGQTIHCLVLEG
jgi:molybdopterin molybdotransferase